MKDGSHIPPYFLGNNVDFATKCTRQFLIDLGADKKASSIRWFMEYYPIKNWTEIHAFEIQDFDKDAYNIPKGIKYHKSFITIIKNEPETNFADFLTNKIKIDPDHDCVVVKMDIEGYE